MSRPVKECIKAWSFVRYLDIKIQLYTIHTLAQDYALFGLKATGDEKKVASGSGGAGAAGDAIHDIPDMDDEEAEEREWKTEELEESDSDKSDEETRPALPDDPRVEISSQSSSDEIQPVISPTHTNVHAASLLTGYLAGVTAIHAWRL